MRKIYKKQPIVAVDWPPRVGQDFFGRLELVTKEESATQPNEECQSAWSMLRGEVDKIPNLPGYKEITVEDVLKSNSSGIYVIIDGPPGIGKTTLCRKLLNMWSNGTLPHQQYSLVLYCPLRNTRVASATTLAELFTYENLEEPIIDWMSKKKGEGMLIIFDGWDELSVKHRNSSLVARIACRELLTECSLIFTSRSYASSSLLRLSHFNKHVQVIGFSREEIFTVVIKTIQKDPEESQKVIDIVFKDQTYGLAQDETIPDIIKILQKDPKESRKVSEKFCKGQTDGLAQNKTITDFVEAAQKYAEEKHKVFDTVLKGQTGIGLTQKSTLNSDINRIQKYTEESQKFIDTDVVLNSDSESALKLIKDLIVHGDVLSLCYVPLICSMVIFVYCKLGRLPTTLTQLYENFILQTIRRHVQIKKRHDENDPYAIETLSSLPQQLVKPFEELCQLAYTNLANTRMTFTSSQLQQLSSEAFNEDFLGLITTFIDYDEKTHQFLHLTIQEFLAAWWISKNEETERKFKDHFDDDHFQMCLRFTAGLTHLEHESYQQYFNKWQFDLHCTTQLSTVFETSCRPSFSKCNSLMTANCCTGCKKKFFETTYGPIKLFHIRHLFQLLYESQNATLCGVLAQSIVNASICLDTEKLSLFETLCFGYFINNSNTTWNQLHLVLPNEQCIAAITKGPANDIQCKALKLSLGGCSNESIHKLAQRPLLCNVQELHCSLIGSDFVNSFTHDFVLLEALKLPHLKILYFNEDMTYGRTDSWSELEKCLETKLTLKELHVTLPSAKSEGNKSIVNSIIRGVTRNKIMTSFSLTLGTQSDFMHDIRALLKQNKTLKAFTLIKYIDLHSNLEPMQIKVIRAPLTSLRLELSVGGEKQTELMLQHIKGLKCLILQPVACKYPSSVQNMLDSLQQQVPLQVPLQLIFDSHPGLQQLGLQLDTEENAITLFTHLMTNTTLKALKIWMYYEPLLSIPNVGIKLKDMLEKNATLQCFEVEVKNSVFFCKTPFTKVPIGSKIKFMSLMANGLRCNTNIQQLRIPWPIAMPPRENDTQTFLHNIFHMEHLKELQLHFHLAVDKISTILKMVHNPDYIWSISDFMEVLFYEQVLPALTKMLQLKKPIRSLSIQCDILGHSNSEQKKIVEQFYEAIFLHPTLEYTEVISIFSELEPIFEAQKEALIAKHKKKQPIPKVVHISKIL